MHLVFLNQYYPPDAAPTGVMLRAVAEECVRQGHQVTVICADGGYAGDRRVEGLKAEGQISGDGERGGVSATVANCSSIPQNQQSKIDNHQSSISPSSPSTLNPELSTSPTPTIHRLPATRFGRGTFVGKLLDYASYYLGVAWRLGTMNPPPDRIVALTTPPYLSVLARVVSKLRGADHAHWVMDLYPDVMVAHGMLAEGGWKHRLLAGIARWGFSGRRSAAVLTLGPDMAARCRGVIRSQSPESRVRTEVENPKSEIQNHQSSISPVSWVPLWGVGELRNGSNGDRDLEDKIAAGRSGHGLRRDAAATGLRLARGWAADELVVMYSGNMGLGHRFGEILEVAGARVSSPAEPMEGESPAREESPGSPPGTSFPPHRPGESGDSRSGAAARPPTAHRQPPTLQKTRFVFYGGGKRRGEIEALMAAHPDAPVELHDYAPAGELAAHLMTADVHLVSLEPAWSGTMVPSKLQGIFAVGRPVVFVGSADSSIGRWVLESGGGWVVAAGDVAGLRSALDEACDPEVRSNRGEAAAKFAKSHFDRITNVKRVVGIFVGDSRAG
jgi:hypothetical protein